MTRDAKYHIETTPSRLSIETRKARLELSHKEAKLDVQTELPRVIIDQYECFATSGLMNVFDLTREAAQRGMQQALIFAGKVAGDGDRMAALENPSPLPDIVLRDAFPEKEFVLDYMPKARPKISVTGGVQISDQGNGQGITNGVQGTYIPGSVSYQYTPAQVRINMQQYASISMRYERTKFSSFV